MASTPRIIRDKFTSIEKELFAQRDALQKLFSRQQQEVIVDREPDDEGAEANRNLANHLALAALDRERKTLSEIELALKRLKAGAYGVCETCGEDIAKVRLQALPWARFCIHCAERRAA